MTLKILYLIDLIEVAKDVRANRSSRAIGYISLSSGARVQFIDFARELNIIIIRNKNLNECLMNV